MAYGERFLKTSIAGFPIYLLFLLSVWTSCTSSEKASTPKIYLEVLGIAQDAGAPQIGCSKACCTAIRKQESLFRVSSLGLVDPIRRKSWMFDATPDFSEQYDALTQFGKFELDGVFLTHAHMGHYTGLMYLGREAMGAERVNVYAMPRMRSFLQENGPWSQLVGLKNIQLIPMRHDSLLRITPSISVKPIRVPHRDEFSETVGFWIEGPEKEALFIPDIDKWREWNMSILEMVSAADYAFIDATFYDENELPGRNMEEIPHPFVQETMTLFGEAPLEIRDKVYLIHLNHTNDLLDRDSKAYQEVSEFGFHVAERGLRLEM
jgi:pyrroloquinoline quinone biosynthesis protein B